MPRPDPLAEDTRAAALISEQLGALAASMFLSDKEFALITTASVAMTKAKALLIARLEARDGDSGAAAVAPVSDRGGGLPGDVDVQLGTRPLPDGGAL
jgi:hypothetical protein